jgi:flagellar basal-body rod protein FlgG
MADALAIAARSMADDIARLAAISHNLANAATPGFKADIAVSRPFIEFIQAALPDAGASLATTLPELQAWTNHRAGPLQHTGHALDIAIEGDGFFELEDASGPIYTRQGNFQLDGSGRIVDAVGRVVLGSGGEMRVDSAAPRIDASGRVYDGDKPVGSLRIVRFEQPQALAKLGAGLYAANAQAAQPVTEPRLRQGYVEASNVVAAHEMVQLIETMRHFESNQKVIQGYDEMLERTIRTLGEF